MLSRSDTTPTRLPSSIRTSPKLAPSLELLFLGTGTSSSVPSIGCLTSPLGCLCCRSTLTSDPEAVKNVRRNTSAVLRIPSSEEGGRTKSLLIDCGKTFYTAALEWWPKKGLREIDAVLLTHPHSDAILGLDDLRGWTLHSHVQKSIDIYVNQFTYDEVSKSFPYLTDVSKATGGGDVPQFQWHIFDDGKPLTILGVSIVPLPVHHGKFFSTPPQPYYCLGFLFNSQIAYVSDTSFVPEEVWDLLEENCTLPPQWRPESSSLTNGVDLLSLEATTTKPVLQALVIDCLRIEAHTSHFGLPQAIATGRRLGAQHTYLLGFGHATSHASWVHTATSFSSGGTSSLPSHAHTREPKAQHTWQMYSGTKEAGEEDVEVFREHALRAVESWEGGVLGGIWVRPACDGMTVEVGEEGVRDDVYE